MGYQDRKTWVATLIGWTIGIIWIIPFIGILMASLRPSAEIADGWWVMKDLTISLQNYQYVLFDTTIPLLRPLWNSLIIALLGTLIPVVLSLGSGYAFARHYIPSKKLILVILLSLMAIPLQMVSVPIFRIMNVLGLLDSIWSVTILNTVTAIPWMLFFMMNFIVAQPIEVEEAARIDGCDSLQIFTYIVTPQCIPGLISACTLQFVWCWVDFFLPLIFLYSPEKYTAVQVIPMLRGQFLANWGGLSAASVIVTAIPFILFMFLQKYYIKGNIGWVPEK
jgi:multiple sugar transport system permease protein